MFPLYCLYKNVQGLFLFSKIENNIQQMQLKSGECRIWGGERGGMEIGELGKS